MYTERFGKRYHFYLQLRILYIYVIFIFSCVITVFVMKQKLSFEPTSRPPEASHFVLRSDLLPSYIPVRVANKILFVGESIQMFQLKRDGHQKTEGLHSMNMEIKSFMYCLHMSCEYKLLTVELYTFLIQ